MKTTATIALALAAAALPVAAQAQNSADKAAATAARAAEADENKRLGSQHLRCDGEPNNMSGTESFARLLGAVSLLALFAPPVEAPDPSKRLFAEKGIDACSRLIDPGEKVENNGLRRIPLILARALHRIEAKDYAGALTDVDKARGEAQALNLIGNPYFDRSMGLSFDLIEAEARVRMGDAAGARAVGLRNQARMPMSGYTAVAARPLVVANREPSDQEIAFYRSSQKINLPNFVVFAARLEEAGRFAEAAEQRESWIQLLDTINTKKRSSGILALAAISHALAGDWTKAEARAQEARTNMEALVAAGQAEGDRAGIVEALDFYQILVLAKEGKVDDARRNFAARSLWTQPSLGQIMAANGRLRQGARPDQLFGGLAKTSDDLWEDRRKQAVANRLESDTKNRALFSYILPYAPVKDYEALSSEVWRPKSNLMGKEPIPDSAYYAVRIYGAAMTQPDALLLHTANQAKVRGTRGFVFLMLPGDPNRALVRFVNPGDPGVPQQLYLDADTVIAEQRQLIPSPAELAARRAPKKKG